MKKNSTYTDALMSIEAGIQKRSHDIIVRNRRFANLRCARQKTPRYSKVDQTNLRMVVLRKNNVRGFNVTVNYPTLAYVCQSG